MTSEVVPVPVPEPAPALALVTQAEWRRILHTGFEFSLPSDVFDTLRGLVQRDVLKQRLLDAIAAANKDGFRFAMYYYASMDGVDKEEARHWYNARVRDGPSKNWVMVKGVQVTPSGAVLFKVFPSCNPKPQYVKLYDPQTGRRPFSAKMEAYKFEDNTFTDFRHFRLPVTPYFACA